MNALYLQCMTNRYQAPEETAGKDFSSGVRAVMKTIQTGNAHEGLSESCRHQGTLTQPCAIAPLEKSCTALILQRKIRNKNDKNDNSVDKRVNN